MLTLQLRQTDIQLLLQIIHHLGLFTFQLNDALVLLFTQELEAVDQRDFIIIRVLEDGAVFLMFQTIRLIQQSCHLDVDTCNLGKLAGLELIGQHVPLGLGIGKALCLINLGQFRNLGQNLALLLIVPLGYQERNRILIAEGVRNTVECDTLLGRIIGVNNVLRKTIVTLSRQKNTRNDGHKEDGRQDIAQLDHRFAHQTDARHQIGMSGALDAV